MIKVFFDVDGVLIDGWHSDPNCRKPWDANIERDLGIDRAAFQERFFRPSASGSPSPMEACVRGEMDLKDALAELLPTLGYDGPVDTFATYWFENDSNINHEVLEIAKRLRSTGCDLYLVTGQEHHRAAYLWENLGLREHFKEILYSARLGHLKSEAAFYDKVNEALGIVPEESPVFFDDQESVVRLARAAGWDARIFNGPRDILDHERLQRHLPE